MLTIKKVPTVVSNYQEDNNTSNDTEEDATQSQARGFGRNCLDNCCLPVSELPLYVFKKNENESEGNAIFSYDVEVSPISFLNNLLLGQWEDRMRIAQLNEGRHLKKRPTEFRIDEVLQPFDENKFNFMKVGQEEVLLRFESSSDDRSHFFSSYPLDACSSSPSIVAINVSPIEYGHVPLIPRILDCLPQRIDHESFLLALYFAKKLQILS